MNLDQRDCYVYALFCSDKIFYIGAAREKPNGERARGEEHLDAAKRGSTQPVSRRIRQIWSQGGLFEFRVLQANLNIGEAALLEQEWIKKIGLDNLTNVRVWAPSPNGPRQRRQKGPSLKALNKLLGEANGEPPKQPRGPNLRERTRLNKLARAEAYARTKVPSRVQ